MVDRFNLLRQSLKALLSFGLEDTVAVDAMCLMRTHKLGACFVDASTSLPAHVLKRNSFPGSGETSKNLGNLLNDDLRLQVGELTRTAKAAYSAATPPEAYAVFAMPPLPGFPALPGFVRSGNAMYKLLRADSGGGVSPARSTE